MGNLVVQPLHSGLQGFQLLLQTGTLFNQNILAGFFSTFLEKQGNVVDEGFDLYSGAAHTFGKFDPAAGGLVKIPDAVFFAGDMRDEPDPFVIADGVSG